ncbi:hypothetical protein ACFLVS_05475 [Chloroflexota bacterium]
MLIDTPTEVVSLLNRLPIRRIDYLMFTHLDPDHMEGFRVVEQITLDFRSWHAYPEKQICLLLPKQLSKQTRKLRSQYGPLLDFYQESGFIRLEPFRDKIQMIKDVAITAIPVDRCSQLSFVYVFQKSGHKVVCAPCYIKPFPEHRNEVYQAEKKHGSIRGKYQEKEGPPIARQILARLGFKQSQVEEICEIIAHHHSQGKINTQNFKILYDADWLVNLRDEYDIWDRTRLSSVIDKLFLTSSGRALAREVYF